MYIFHRPGYTDESIIARWDILLKDADLPTLKEHKRRAEGLAATASHNQAITYNYIAACLAAAICRLEPRKTKRKEPGQSP
jgi:hypothetical protein